MPVVEQQPVQFTQERAAEISNPLQQQPAQQDEKNASATENSNKKSRYPAKRRHKRFKHRHRRPQGSSNRTPTDNSSPTNFSSSETIANSPPENSYIPKKKMNNHPSRRSLARPPRGERKS